MAVRLLFLFFVVVLFGFGYISVLNGQRIPFFYSSSRQVEIAVSELSILAFALGAAMVILGTLVKDVTQASLTWRERREKQRREAARARIGKAAGLFERGMLDEAAKELKKSLSVNPDDRDALDLLSRVEAVRGDRLEAVKALTRIKQLDPSDLSVYFRLASLYRDMNDLENALSVLKTIEDVEGENPRAWKAIRDIHIRRGDMIAAYATQQKLMKHKGKSASLEDIALFTGLRYEKAMARFAEGKIDDAERRLNELAQDQPHFAAAFVALSEIARVRGKNGEATATLHRGFRASRHPVFLIKLEDLAVETESPQAMIGVYTELLQEYPADFDVNLFFGKFFLRLEMNDEAMDQLLKAELIDPERESLHILLAEAFRRRGRFESACQHYQRAYGYKRRYLVPFRCTACGTSTIKWTARCPACDVWNGYSIDHGRREFAITASVR
jgi:predicted Zn-dependent protease